MRPLGVWSYWRYLTLSLKEPKNDLIVFEMFGQKFFSSKINLKHVADIVFDLGNKFRENRMKFGNFGEKIFVCQF
jgi:hypothetical protein